MNLADEARDDFDSLLEALLPFAQQQLGKHGEFLPFAAAVGPEGEVQIHGADTGEEHPPSLEVVDLLVGGFREERAGLRAVGICLNARVATPEGKEADAICVQLEHSGGDALDAFLPYRRNWRGKIVYEDLGAGPGTSRVF